MTHKKLSRRELEILRQNGISPDSKLVRADHPTPMKSKGRNWIHEVAELRQEVRNIDKRIRALSDEIAVLQQSRSGGQPKSVAEQRLRAEKRKAGKLRFKLDHKADLLEYSHSKRTDLRFDSAVGVRGVVSGGLPSSRR